MSGIAAIGTKKERETFRDVVRHYDMAKEDLENRREDFDAKDILFRSHIVDEGDKAWPYQAKIFDPRTFTAIFEKTARILANKPKGRMVPREGGDAIGAKINNSVLDFQWDDNERANGMPMIAKWQLMDMNARKYGAAFGICKWKYERKLVGDKKDIQIYYDGPNFKPLNNRDCLPNPSYSTIKHWFQYREYVTLNELQNVNDAARGKPIYKNIDILRTKLREDAQRGGDRRDVNYLSKNKEITGVSDYLGEDEVYKVVEIVTEYRSNRWITFAPRHGIILRDIPNPYIHGQIPIVLLKYFPIDDDLYGLSEIEPVEKLQRAINAISSQYIDAINMSLYTPLKVRSIGGAVQLHTLEFGPGKKWLMTDPVTDVLPHDQSISGVSEFTSTYRFLVSAMQEGLGETSQGISNLAPGDSNKTATEIRDLAIQRSARDNYNQIFLGEAIKKQMTFWYKMNQQFLFSSPEEKFKVIRIVGKDAIKYFQKVGLDEFAVPDETVEAITLAHEKGVDFNLEEVMKPIYGVKVDGKESAKFELESDGSSGKLVLEPKDLAGTYDYIPDIDTMRLPDQGQIIVARKQALELAINPNMLALLQREGTQMKVRALFEDYLEAIGLKDADKYFEEAQNEAQQTGAGGAQPGQESSVNGQPGGLAGNSGPVVAGESNAIVPGSIGI